MIENFYKDSECTEEILDIGKESDLYTNDCLQKTETEWIMNTCVSDGKVEVKMYSAAGCHPEDNTDSFYIVHDECVKVDDFENTYKRHTIKGHCPGAAYCPEGSDWSCEEGWHLKYFVEGEQPECGPGADSDAEIVEQQCEEEFQGKWIFGVNGGTCVPPEIENDECAGFWEMEHEVFGADVCLFPAAVCKEVTPQPTGKPTLEPTSSPTGEPTASPTGEPTSSPTNEPSSPPTNEPSDAPVTPKPTQAAETQEPTDEVTPEPSKAPETTPAPTEGSGEACGFSAKKVKVKSTGKQKKIKMKDIDDPADASCTCATLCESEDSIVWSYHVKKQQCSCMKRKDGAVVTVSKFKKTSVEKAKFFVSVKENGEYEA